MTLNDLIKKLQQAINNSGFVPPLKEDGDFGPKTALAADEVELEIKATRRPSPVTPPPLILGPVNPAYVEAKKYEGKKETDSKFGAFLSGFWPKVGLPSYKTIIGTSFAWCGLFIAAMSTNVGQDFVKGAAGAKNWDRYGQEIEWKANGIPRGAVVRLNHNLDCSSAKGNHVAFSDGDCAAGDLKSNVAINLYGGNQSNEAKVSAFSVKEVCSVRWPSELPKPKAVTKSVGCTGKPTGGSTR